MSTTSNDESALQQLVASGIRIPPQPEVVLELQRMLLADDYTTARLAQVIGRDPGIVAALFKAAHSPAFKRSRKPTSLEQVVMTLGVKQTFNLVQAIALSTSVSDKSRKTFEVFWTRSLEVARLAAIIAEDRVTVCNVFADQAYLAGVFLECGVPVLMMRFPAYCESLRLDQACCWPNLTEQDARFAVDHVSVGYLVARHWKLPDFVCSAILYHHEPPSDALGAALSLVCIVQLAVHFYHRMARQTDPLWDRIGPRAMAELGLAADDEADYFEQITQVFLAE